MKRGTKAENSRIFPKGKGDPAVVSVPDTSRASCWDGEHPEQSKDGVMMIPGTLSTLSTRAGPGFALVFRALAAVELLGSLQRWETEFPSNLASSFLSWPSGICSVALPGAPVLQQLLHKPIPGIPGSHWAHSSLILQICPSLSHSL